MGNKSKHRPLQQQNQNNPTSGRQLVSREEITISAGPIPSPDQLERYEKISVGAANKIISMAEKVNTHRIEIQTKAVEAQIRDNELNFNYRRRGQDYALCITLTGFAFSFVLLLTDHWVVGTIFSSGILLSLVGAFLATRNASNSGDENQNEETTDPRP